MTNSHGRVCRLRRSCVAVKMSKVDCVDDESMMYCLRRLMGRVGDCLLITETSVFVKCTTNSTTLQHASVNFDASWMGKQREQNRTTYGEEKSGVKLEEDDW